MSPTWLPAGWIFLLFITHCMAQHEARLCRDHKNKQNVLIGVMFPKAGIYIHGQRKLNTEVNTQIREGKAFGALQRYCVDVPIVTFSSMDPIETVRILCDSFVAKKVAAIIFISSSEKYGANTKAAQYLFHMVSHTGIPLIAWNNDASSILVNQDLSKYRAVQLAPSIELLAKAMMSILKLYGWSRFAIVASSILAGGRRFADSLHQLARETRPFDDDSSKKWELLKDVSVNTNNVTATRDKLQLLSKTDARIFLLYATAAEAEKIFEEAEKLQLTRHGYLWIVAHSVIANVKVSQMDVSQSHIPNGTLAVYFDSDLKSSSSPGQIAGVLRRGIHNAYATLANALIALERDYHGSVDLRSTAGCDSDVNYTWPTGEILYAYIKNATVQLSTEDINIQNMHVRFDEKGRVNDSYISIMNLQNKNWIKVGFYAKDTPTLFDIMWPGGQRTPPKGRPEKFHLKIVTLDEPPFINVNEPEHGKCQEQMQVECQWSSVEMASRNATETKCCTGFCVDLLKKLADDIGFTFRLYKVKDGKWGIKNDNGKWDGMVADLVEGKADMCVTALKINSDRQKDIDFSVPFLETGIAIMVAVKRGALSATAFLEPFEYSTWVFILIVSIQAAAVAIFVYEWMSPQSYDMKLKPPEGHKFSLFRSYWLVWATLFSASVNTDVPKSHTSRFMALIWAAFSMTFLAVYTANLAAFMITRNDYHALTGISDPKITNPTDHAPPFKYGTVSSGNTQDTLRRNYKKLYKYMAVENRFFKSNVSDGVAAVKRGEYDAFIYDAVVLEYLAGKDESCEILTVGKLFSMTGYGFGFPKKSARMKDINKKILHYQATGALEKMQNFWFAGSCRKNSKESKSHSAPLGMENFVSAFGLLAAGTVLCFLVLLIEYIYCKYVRQRLAKIDRKGYCGLISLSMGKSLTFHEAVEKVHTDFKEEKLRSMNHRSKRERFLENQLGSAHNEIRNLEKRLSDASKFETRSVLTMDDTQFSPVHIYARRENLGRIFESPLLRRRELESVI